MNTQNLKPIFFALLLSACSSSPQEKLAKLNAEKAKIEKEILALQKELNTTDTSGMKSTPVAVMDVQSKRFANYISMQGRIDAKQNVIASSQLPGVVKSILVKNGQYVSKGQVLAYLDDNVIKQGMAELDQQIAFALDVFKKRKNLWDQNIGSEIEMLSAKNNYEAMVKKKNTTLAQSSMYRITSPIFGVIDAINIKVGEMAAPGSPLGIRVVNDHDLKVVADVGEGYISQVDVGDKVLVILPDLNDTISSKITYVSKTINDLSRAFTIEISLPSNSHFKPNMIVDLKIAGYEKDNAFVVPAGLLQRGAEGDYIMVLRNNKVTQAYIKKGSSYNGEVEILNGLLISDKIITQGYQNLQPNDPFKIISQN